MNPSSSSQSWHISGSSQLRSCLLPTLKRPMGHRKLSMVAVLSHQPQLPSHCATQLDHRLPALSRVKSAVGSVGKGVLVPTCHEGGPQLHLLQGKVFRQLTEHSLDNGLVGLVKEVDIIEASHFDAHEVGARLCFVDDHIEGERLVRVEEGPVPLLGPEVFLKFQVYLVSDATCYACDGLLVTRRQFWLKLHNVFLEDAQWQTADHPAGLVGAPVGSPDLHKRLRVVDGDYFFVEQGLGVAGLIDGINDSEIAAWWEKVSFCPVVRKLFEGEVPQV